MIRNLLIAMLVLSVLLSAVFFFELFSAVPAAAVPGEEDVVFRCGSPDSDLTAITCNVDWGEEQIPAILQILEEKNVHITFFVSGKWAEEHPALLRELYIRGHEIQSHGYSHKLCSQVSEETVRKELEKTAFALQTLLGIHPTVFAPPSGDYDAKTLSLCRELGYKVSLWSADTIDWKEGSTAEVITRRIFKKDLHGGVILMHPKEETVKALPAIIDGISRQGLTMVTLTELMERSALPGLSAGGSDFGIPLQKTGK
ncbi:MAG: polysaccharide deacetylase family protein [Firmicutes bacterium]|nr:polysaccharide deacetylase family protein [Bacillota bacterium]